MNIRPPTDSGFEDADPDRCEHCHRWIRADGECEFCGDAETRKARSLDSVFESLFNNGKTYEQ